DLPEHLAADLHVHTGRSYDSFLPDRLRWQSLLAAGLDVVVVTDHNEVVDPAPGLDVVTGQGSPLHGLPGVEHDLRHPTSANWDLGHMNAFPVLGSDVAPLPKKELEVIGRALGDFRVRQERNPYPGVGSEVVLQLNHARGIHFFPDRPPNRGAWPLFERVGFDRDVPVGEGSNGWMLEADPATGATAMDFDALEIVNRFSWELYLDLRQDWFVFLNQGFFMTGTGNSDSHAMEVEVAGFPVNLVRAPRPAPGEALDAGAFVGALRQGAVLVSTGPVVDLVLETPFGASSPGDVVSFTGTALARVRVQAAPWVPVDEVRLVVGGDVVQRWEVPVPEPGEPVDMEVVWPIGIAADTWVIAEAGWPLESNGAQPYVGGDYGLVAPGYVPLGFTNPVRIDGDGDGRWGAS
ncbi:MAG: PHP domain-containing protein, partial [Deltaproteobacteria bacterium]|nr:PHP domain-containing protein [Deltaproteobacteria bacterium]